MIPLDHYGFSLFLCVCAFRSDHSNFLTSKVPMQTIYTQKYNLSSPVVHWSNVPLKSFITMSLQTVQETTIPYPTTIPLPVERNGGFKYVPLPPQDGTPSCRPNKTTKRTMMNWNKMEFVSIGTKMKICDCSWVELCTFILTFPLSRTLPMWELLPWH